MGRLITVSARIAEDLKKRADDLGINISALTRRALEDEIRRIDREHALRAIDEEATKSPELPEGSIVEMIREMREGRGVGR